jgi:hypothetical protein
LSHPVTKEEIDRVPSEHRAPHEAIYAFLAKIPEVNEQLLMPRPVSAGPGPFGPGACRRRGVCAPASDAPHRDDARHVFRAIKNGSGYFITTDEKSILNRAAEIEARFPILVRRPSQLIETSMGLQRRGRTP